MIYRVVLVSYIKSWSEYKTGCRLPQVKSPRWEGSLRVYMLFLCLPSTLDLGTLHSPTTQGKCARPVSRCRCRFVANILIEVLGALPRLLHLFFLFCIYLQPGVHSQPACMLHNWQPLTHMLSLKLITRQQVPRRQHYFLF